MLTEKVLQCWVTVKCFKVYIWTRSKIVSYNSNEPGQCVSASPRHPRYTYCNRENLKMPMTHGVNHSLNLWLMGPWALVKCLAFISHSCHAPPTQLIIIVSLSQLLPTLHSTLRHDYHRNVYHNCHPIYGDQKQWNRHLELCKVAATHSWNLLCISI